MFDSSLINDNRIEDVDVDETTNYSEEELRSKLKEYIHFIDNTLQPELEKAVSLREEIEFEINEYNALKTQLEIFIDQQNGGVGQARGSDNEGGEEAKNIPSMKAMVDLGCQTVYCQAKVTNPNMITVDIGKGIHAQLSLEEAKQFCIRRVQFLETNILPARVTKAQTVASHLEDALTLLESLGKELRSMEK